MMLPAFQMYTLKLALYERPEDFVRAVGEVFIAIGCVYYLGLQFAAMKKSRPRCRYVQEPANAFDVLLQVRPAWNRGSGSGA